MTSAPQDYFLAWSMDQAHGARLVHPCTASNHQHGDFNIQLGHSWTGPIVPKHSN